MANKLGTVQPVFVHTSTGKPAVIGTECVMHVDGRLSHANAVAYVAREARAYAERSGGRFEWSGEAYLLAGRHTTVTLRKVTA